MSDWFLGRKGRRKGGSNSNHSEDDTLVKYLVIFYKWELKSALENREHKGHKHVLPESKKPVTKAESLQAFKLWSTIGGSTRRGTSGPAAVEVRWPRELRRPVTVSIFLPLGNKEEQSMRGAESNSSASIYQKDERDYNPRHRESSGQPSHGCFNPIFIATWFLFVHRVGSFSKKGLSPKDWGRDPILLV